MMYLREIFEQDDDGDNDVVPQATDMENELRLAAADLIVPLISQHVPFITVDQAIQALSSGHTGLVITRQTVMDVLSPEKVKAVQKIEGDRIYFQYPDENVEQGEQDQQQELNHVADMATDQAQQNVKGDNLEQNIEQQVSQSIKNSGKPQ